MQELSTYKTQPSLTTIPPWLALRQAVHSIMTTPIHTGNTTILASSNRRSMARSHLPTTAHLNKRMYYAKPCIAVESLRKQMHLNNACVNGQETLYTVCKDPLFHESIATKTRRVLDKNKQRTTCTSIEQAVIVTRPHITMTSVTSRPNVFGSLNGSTDGRLA